MPLSPVDYEIPLLQALIVSGGEAKTSDIYPVVEKSMEEELEKHPEEYGTYKREKEIIWNNKLRWAREYLKRKGQLDASEWGIWKITQSGKERVRIFQKFGRDLDESLVKLHQTGDVLGIRSIIYEPVNEQGVILLFGALAHDLGFRVEGIRNKFPDALLRRKKNGRWVSYKAEFEYKSDDFRTHGHDSAQCDLLICWEHNWKGCPIEVLSLKEESRRF